MLLDLETRTPVDLLPDRTAETLAAWLVAHPGVQLISRDRAGEYARGAKKGAPNAIQVADRFHLTKNLSEVVERILSHHRQALRQIRFMRTSAQSSSSLAVRYVRPDRKLRKQEVLQAKQVRAEQIQTLVAQGMTQLAIARQLHLNRKTVALYAEAQSITPVSQPARAGILAPFTRYLATRWQTGERNGVGLYREIVAQGYTGSRMTVERFLLGLRDLERQGQLPAVLSAPVEMTPHRAVGLLLKRAEERTQEETQALLRVDQIHPDVARTRLLMQQFLQLLRERHGHELDQWLAAAFHSGVPEWRAFVRKLRQDHAAVQAGLTLKWSQRSRCIMHLVYSDHYHFNVSQSLLLLLRRRKETRSTIIVAHPSNASLMIPAPNGLSRDAVTLRQFFGSQHALSSQACIAIWQDRDADEVDRHACSERAAHQRCDSLADLTAQRPGHRYTHPASDRWLPASLERSSAIGRTVEARATVMVCVAPPLKRIWATI